MLTIIIIKYRRRVINATDPERKKQTIFKVILHARLDLMIIMKKKNVT